MASSVKQSGPCRNNAKLVDQALAVFSIVELTELIKEIERELASKHRPNEVHQPAVVHEKLAVRFSDIQKQGSTTRDERVVHSTGKRRGNTKQGRYS